MMGEPVTKQHFDAAFILLGVPPERVNDVVSVLISEGRIVIDLIYRDEAGKMVITRHDGAVLERLRAEILS